MMMMIMLANVIIVVIKMIEVIESDYHGSGLDYDDGVTAQSLHF